MVRAIMHGCNGKMGQVIAGLIRDDAAIELVAGVDPYTGVENPFPVFKSIQECDVEADVIIDFAAAAAVDSLLAYCVEKKVPCVLCTTGLSEEQLKKVEEASKEVAILKSANMSLGVNVLLSLCKKAAVVLHDNFDIEIVEMHHNQKLDAPSGTALLLANGINQMLPIAAEYEYNRQPKREKRPKNQIGIHSLRGGTVVGEHSVIFAGHNETLTLSHSASSREVFACGALRAAKYLRGKEHGKYSMDDLIQATLS